MPTSEAVIVGAGPTGLSSAIGLLQQGRMVTVIDDRESHEPTSRAAVVHAYTLERLKTLGVADRLVELGLKINTFTLRDRDRLLFGIEFDRLPTAYPYVLMVPQSTTEQVLLDRLTELGGAVLRPRRLDRLEQHEDSVSAVLDDGSRVEAQYLVGADGMHSTVREQAGIGFAGGSYPESFALADVRLSDGIPPGEVILYFSPAGMMVVAPLPDGMFRIVATVDRAPRHPDVAFVQQLMDRRGPERHSVRVEEVSWGSRFHVQHRIAERYRSGRVLLAGDAAHVHSPAGGQGMNAGITDAILLAEELGAVLSGAQESRLDSYQEQRRPVAEQVVGLADRLTRLATIDAGRRRIRNAGLAIAGNLPPVRHRFARQLSGLNYR
ncbi:FAD-dependent monooxygenase [Microlunatus sp. Gsoil 973]|uniref:FAD-dependent monooxygenase n=1 Tax=Microlunatus sp. Gsoil 973 TaxID=2672569 RepID=UPI0012B4BD30|nr:FAD-dependent monooxygenase [Microlunatus sp. Gsoil 973]QGN31506.1 pentachlorophenol monooxygenase [Microlunatus sp. Gsoil 973]